MGTDNNRINRFDCGYAQEKKVYDSFGNVKKCSFIGADGKPAVRKEGGYASFEYIYRNGERAETRYYDQEGNLTFRQDSGYAIIKKEFDEFSRCVSELYFGVKDEPVISTKYRCAGMEYDYDEMGNESVISYLGLDGNITARNDRGVAEVRTEYDFAGNVIRQCYLNIEDGETEAVIRRDIGYASFESIYENGNCVETRYFDIDGELTLCTDGGYAIIKKRYNDEGNCISERYYGQENQPIISTKYDCAGVNYYYNERGELTDREYIGLNGQRIIRSDYGCAQIKRMYDEYGNIILESYLNLEGKPIVRTDLGYAAYKAQYERGKMTRVTYLDADNDLTFCKENYAVAAREYDDFGRLVLEQYYDGDIKPVLNTKYNCNGLRYEYNGDGREVIVQYLDQDGKLMFQNTIGCAQIRRIYDAVGNLIEETALDMEGLPIVEKGESYAAVKKKYEKGQLLEIRYLDGNGNLVMSKKHGYAVLKRKYNELCQLEQEYYYDIKEEPVISEQYHYAGLKYQYDKRGNQNYIWYCGLDGNYIEPEAFGAKLNYKVYDDYNNLTFDGYFQYNGDNNYQRAIRKDLGYAGIENIYEKKLLLRSEYLDENKELIMNRKEGYAAVKYKYDDKGRKAFEIYYDDKNNVVNCTKGYGMIEYEYDDSGNIKKRHYHDRNQAAAMLENMSA